MTQISLMPTITVLISPMAERDCKYAHSYDPAIHSYDHWSLFTNVIIRYIGRLFCHARPFSLHCRNCWGAGKNSVVAPFLVQRKSCSWKWRFTCLTRDTYQSLIIGKNFLMVGRTLSVTYFASYQGVSAERQKNDTITFKSSKLKVGKITRTRQFRSISYRF